MKLQYLLTLFAYCFISFAYPMSEERKAVKARPKTADPRRGRTLISEKFILVVPRLQLDKALSQLASEVHDGGRYAPRCVSRVSPATCCGMVSLAEQSVYAETIEPALSIAEKKELLARALCFYRKKYQIPTADEQLRRMLAAICCFGDLTDQTFD